VKRFKFASVTIKTDIMTKVNKLTNVKTVIYKTLLVAVFTVLLVTLLI